MLALFSLVGVAGRVVCCLLCVVLIYCDLVWFFLVVVCWYCGLVLIVLLLVLRLYCFTQFLFGFIVAVAMLLCGSFVYWLVVDLGLGGVWWYLVGFVAGFWFLFVVLVFVAGGGLLFDWFAGYCCFRVTTFAIDC